MAAGEELDIDDARRAVLAAVEPLGSEALALDDALGRVLGEDVVAGEPLPAFDSSAMDGYAVQAADVTGASDGRPVRLQVVGESRAGHAALTGLRRGQAIAISTGAAIPAGADAIVRVERTRGEAGVVDVLEGVATGAEIRPAGEDVAAGATVLRRGDTLGPAALGMLAALGHARVRCARRPRVSVLVTGDELVSAAGGDGSPDEGADSRNGASGALREGTVRDSNSYAVGALVRCAGAELAHTGRVPDERQATRAALAHAVVRSDAVVVCGGVSVGAHDHVRPSLRALGAAQAFWGLALKPGHPTWFGTLDGTPVFGLPGNPVSAMVTFVLLVGPALHSMQGATAPLARATAMLDGGYAKPAGRAHALRCRLTACEDGWHARPSGPQRSNILNSMLGADALAIVPGAATRLHDGERVEIEPLAPWTAWTADRR